MLSRLRTPVVQDNLDLVINYIMQRLYLIYIIECAQGCPLDAYGESHPRKHCPRLLYRRNKKRYHEETKAAGRDAKAARNMDY